MKDVKIKISVDSKGAEKKVKSLGKEVKKTTTETGKAGGALSKGFAGLGGAIGGAIPMLGKLRAAIASTGIGAIVIAVAGLVSLFTSVGSKAAEFGKALSNLESITGASASEMEEMSDQAQKLGATTAFTASEVVELQTSLSKLGFKTDDIKNATASILDLAAALGVGLGEAAEVAGSLVKSFGLETEDTQRIVDVMAKAASSSALSFDTIRESMKLVAPVSRATGVSIEKTAALLGVLADNGLKGSIAGTGLAKSFIELNKQGLTLEEGMKRVNESADPLGTAVEMVGVLAGKTFLTLASGSESIEGLEDGLNNSAGAAERMAKIQLDNVSGDVKILGSAWEGLLLSIDKGDGFISKISRSFVQASTSMLGFLTKTKSATDAIKKEQTELFLLESQLLDTNTSEEDRLEIIDGLQKKYPDFLKNIDKEKVTNSQLKSALKGVNEQLIQKIMIQSQEEALTEKLTEASEKANEMAENSLSLREQVAANNKKFKLEAIEGTLEEQAAEQKRQLLERAGIKNTSEIVGSRKDGYTQLGQSLIDLEKAQNASSSSQVDYNEATEEANELQERNKRILAEMGIVIEDTTDKTEDNNNGNKDAVGLLGSLIEAQEALLEVTKQMPETTEAEIKAKNKSIQVIELEIKRLKELGKVKDVKVETPAQKAKREAAEQKRIDAFSANTKEEARELEKTELTNQFDELYALAEGNEEAQLELTKSYLQRTTALKKKHSDEDLADQAKIDKKTLEDEEALADALLGIQDAKINAVATGFNILGQLAEGNKGLQAAALIGESATGIAKMIIGKNTADLADTAHAATMGVGGAAYLIAKKATNKVNLGIGIASNVAATAKGLSALGQGGAPSGGAEGGQGGAQAPSFNLVEGTESNAIQNTINGAGNKPVKAYVTSGDITTAQQADRQAELNSGF